MLAEEEDTDSLKNIAMVKPLLSETEEEGSQSDDIRDERSLLGWAQEPAWLSYTYTTPIHQLTTSVEKDARVFYMRQRYLLPAHHDALFHCSVCTPTATPLTILVDNWTPFLFSTYGRTILGLQQPHDLPDRSARIKAMHISENPELPHIADAYTLRAPYITFLILMGELTFSVMTTVVAEDTDISQCIIPPIVLVEVQNFVRNMGLHIEVLQLSIFQARPRNGTVLLPFNNNFIQETTQIRGRTCHRFVIPTVITEWIDYARSPLRTHYINP